MQPLSPSLNVRRDTAPHGKEPFIDPHDPAQIAYNHLATITSWAHRRLARGASTTSSVAFEYSSWVLGRPAAALPKPHKSGMAILNAGEGVGRVLSLQFAEAGYTVFALIHPNLDPSEDGSIANLIFVWQQRRAAILASRNKWRVANPSLQFPGLGTVVPLPFMPLSPSSCDKVLNSIKAYCTGHRIDFQTIILTPVFASPVANAPTTQTAETSLLSGLRRRKQSGAGPDTFAGTFSQPHSGTEPEWVPRGHLPRQPGTDEDVPQSDLDTTTQEGSYVPLTIASQAVWERAIQRDVTEQLVAAQALTELLIGETTSSRRLSPKPSGGSSNKPVPIPRSSPQARGNLDGDEETEDDLEERYDSLGWLDLMRDVVKSNVRKVLYRPKDRQLGGRIVWITGVGESSFGAAQGISGPTDAARKAVARGLTTDLSKLGVHLSLVETSPLNQRTSQLANLDCTQIELDARNILSSNSDIARLTSFRNQVRRSRLLGRVSSLWAIDDTDIYWVVKQAVEARYPQVTYTLGFDIAVKHLAGFVPDSVWDLTGWFISERLYGKKVEQWLYERSQSPPLLEPLTSVVAKSLGWVAQRIRDREQLRRPVQYLTSR